MYQKDDNEIIFTSLCLGDYYRNVINTQLQSIIKFSHYKAVIITDNIASFGNWYGERIKFIDINTINNKLPLMSKLEIFNYNLKLVPIKYVVENYKPTICVHMDADTFLFGDMRNVSCLFPNDCDGGLWARLRNKMSESDEHPIIIEKCKQLGYDYKTINNKLPIENIMLFKTGHNLNMFLEEWERLALLSHEVGATSFYESVEMTLALYNTGLQSFNIDGTNFPYADAFRCLHQGKIHTPLIV